MKRFKPEYPATLAHVTGRGACWRSDEVDVSDINQGGTAGFTPVLAKGQVFLFLSSSF
jgi:hypothetical protein